MKSQNDIAANIVVERFGKEDALRALATLRITVFRGWPYLYDGSIAYEEAYLNEFLTDPDAIIVVARVGEIPVGMSTASRLTSQSANIQQAFLDAKADIDNVFYFGESVLLPQFRGSGIGHKFFDERESAAKHAGGRLAAFCAVARPADHPRRPENPRNLEPFWEKRGYRIAPRLSTTMTWKDIDQAVATEHQMRFWLKNIAD